MTLVSDVESRMVSQIDLEMEVAGLSAIEILDEFLRQHPERGYFSRREIVDLLLDIRLILQKGLTDS